jgi:hypothetical protein
MGIPIRKAGQRVEALADHIALVLTQITRLKRILDPATLGFAF